MDLIFKFVVEPSDVLSRLGLVGLLTVGIALFLYYLAADSKISSSLWLVSVFFLLTPSNGKTGVKQLPGA